MACLVLDSVGFVRDGNTILSDVSWSVRPGEHWVVLGPNGCGKSTLLRIAGLATHPSKGAITVLGLPLGRVDIRPLRAKIGTSSASLADQLRPELTAGQVVMCGLNGALEPWWHHYSEANAVRASALLGRFGLAHFADRAFATLSSGERQRVLLARALMPEPALLLFDEPNAGLDLGGREDLIDSFVDLATSHPELATVLVTHHVEEIPPTATHLLAMKAGRVVASGPIASTLTADLLSGVVGRAISLQHNDGRWSAAAARG